MASKRATLPVTAVVLAGGSGSRVGLGVPKQLLKVAGKTVIEHTLDSLQKSPDIDNVMVVIAGAYKDRMESLLRHKYSKLLPLVPGGLDRNQSTKNAILALDGEERKVLLHDAVRPFVDAMTIRRCVEALDHYDAVDVVIESADTVVIVDENDNIVGIPDRSVLRRGQTPQGFLLSTIRLAYERAANAGAIASSDDCGVVVQYLPHVTIHTVRGSEHNMKITYPLDMYIADRMFQFASSPSAETELTLPDGGGMEGKTLVVFGGSYGIGNAIVQVAADRGVECHSYSRSETATDIRDPSGVDEALRAAASKSGKIDWVVNAAALLTRGPLVEMTVAGIEDQIATNYTASALLARSTFPYLRATRGHLLLFTSSSYTRGRAEYSLYSSTKAAVVNMTQALADEWSEAGVHVNCINPERTSTPMRFQNFGYEPEGTLLTAESVAMSALEVLVSDCTGQIVDVRRLGERPIAPVSPHVSSGE